MNPFTVKNKPVVPMTTAPDPNDQDAWDRWATTVQNSITEQYTAWQLDGISQAGCEVLATVVEEQVGNEGQLFVLVPYAELELRANNHPNTLTLVEFANEGETARCIAWIEQSGHGELKVAESWHDALESALDRSGFGWN
jgi:hypothetical protein